MSLRCWTCDAQWPSAWGSRLRRGRPLLYEPQSNGSGGNAARQLKGLTRTLMLALQERIQGGVPVDHPTMLWL
eukprot:15477667-Alexandrium_andersonii.AAC.1